ncbi:DUF3095 domain-containing protein [Aliisedimentitalea scapharcae]|uniref:DUF3095 domain-containing protein n=1 Tax=Aliisedimentitalea scapharcae TaxID=1524259 RepID=A0ABZ2XRK2_9RHOB
MENDGFYSTLLPDPEFAGFSRADRFTALPDDWVVGVTDIVNSTGQIAAGRYKAVNMVGAAVISSMMNGLNGRAFPYVFGGDGASFAVAPSDRETANRILATLRRWVPVEFDMELRAALVPVRDIREAGHDVRVARYAASEGVDYAMFSGGGVSWAEQQMKSGMIEVAPAAVLTSPDLTGLSCRWSNIPAQRDLILSLLVEPTGNEAEFVQVADQIVRLAEQLDRGGHPVPQEGPGLQYPPPGFTLEAHTMQTRWPLALRKVVLAGRTFVSWLIFALGIRMGSFDPAHYRAGISRNADFRKYDDGLKMTLDCDHITRDRLVETLEQARQDGVIRYGLHEQDQAMVTCIVPSAVREDHVHFVDGSAGGYTMAAAQLKS